MPRFYGNDNYTVFEKNLTVTEAKKKIKFSFACVNWGSNATQIYLAIFDSTNTRIAQIGETADQGVYHTTPGESNLNNIDFMIVERADGQLYTFGEVLTIRIIPIGFWAHFYRWFLFELVE